MALEWLGVDSKALRSEVLAGLEEAGLTAADRTASQEGDSLVLICGTAPGAGHLTPELLAAGRVIVVLGPDVELNGEDGWGLLEAGASDVLSWKSARLTIPRIVARLERWRHVDELLESDAIHTHLAGESPRWLKVLRQVVELARFSDTSVLITGETGTGKELVSRLIHTLDPRPDKGDLVLLDCTMVVPTLSGSEFFGHERGAFTGAVSARDGAFALANRGTLFLDEVGELPPTLQAELLRVLQERTYKRVGGNQWKETEFRLVCATNRDLRSQVARGEFRSDLYFRIAAASFHLPPLHERASDIPILAERFLAETNGTSTSFDPDVLEYLSERRYDGNIRELRQLVQRIAARHAGPGPISIGDVPPVDRPRQGDASLEGSPGLSAFIRGAADRGASLKEIRETVSDAFIAHAIEAESESSPKGVTRRVAARLGVSERTIQTWRSSHRDADS